MAFYNLSKQFYVDDQFWQVYEIWVVADEKSESKFLFLWLWVLPLENMNRTLLVSVF